MSSPYAWPSGHARGYEPYPLARPGRRRRGGGHTRFGAIFGGMLVVLVLLGVLGGVINQQNTPTTNCGASCPRPPVTGSAEPAQAVYKSSALGWSLQYQPDTGINVSQQTANAIAFSVQGYPITYSGTQANGRSPAQLAQSYAGASVPGAQLVYTIPNAQLGYVLGYGAVYDTYVQTTGGASQHVRYIVMTSVRSGVAVTVQAIGPYKASTQSDDHPNPSGTPIADYIGRSSSTVTWPGQNAL